MTHVSFFEGGAPVKYTNKPNFLYMHCSFENCQHLLDLKSLQIALLVVTNENTFYPNRDDRSWLLANEAYEIQACFTIKY